jgi:predicted nucleic acid-binding protein
VYLLDTNVVSELRRPRPHGGVLKWLRAVDYRLLRLSAVTRADCRHDLGT